MSYIGDFEKQPGESYTITVDYTGKLPSGAEVDSGTVAAVVVQSGDTDNSVLSSTTATTTTTSAAIKVTGGTDGEDYKVTFTTTLDNTDVLEDDVLMRVREV